MTKTKTTVQHDDVDAATDINTLDAEALILASMSDSMVPRDLTPFQQEELNTAFGVLARFGTPKPLGLACTLIHTPESLARSYIERIPANEPKPSMELAVRNQRKAILSNAANKMLRLARVDLALDDDDMVETTKEEFKFRAVAGTPQLVWYATPSGSLAQGRGEVAWCISYYPDVVDPRNQSRPDTDANTGEKLAASGWFNQEGLMGVVKVYSTIDDADTDAREVRQACRTIRQTKAALVNAPDEVEDDDEYQGPVRPAIPLN